jgi:hypothetical protein
MMATDAATSAQVSIEAWLVNAAAVAADPSTSVWFTEATLGQLGDVLRLAVAVLSRRDVTAVQRETVCRLYGIPPRTAEAWPDVCAALGISRATCYRTRRAFLRELAAAASHPHSPP